ncbi:MAG TPA: regulatory protein GemA [bacterium]|nr:regulatory protein GemA [bacterium]
MIATRASELTPKQLALLHVAKARLGLDDETYRDLLEDEAGVRSARDLDYAGFSAVMRRLERLGFHSRRQLNVPFRPGMATGAQLNYLIALWHRYTGRRDERGLDTWLRKQCGAADLLALDRAGAHKALVALKAMVERQEPPRDGTHG